MIFIDSARFMASSLSNFAKHLAQGIHGSRCTYGYDNKTFEKCGIKYKDCECYVEYINSKYYSLILKCLCCNTSYQKKV